MIEITTRLTICYYCGYAKDCRVVTRRGGDRRAIQVRIVSADDLHTLREWEQVEEVWCTNCGLVYRPESLPGVM